LGAKKLVDKNFFVKAKGTNSDMRCTLSERAVKEKAWGGGRRNGAWRLPEPVEGGCFYETKIVMGKTN